MGSSAKFLIIALFLVAVTLSGCFQQRPEIDSTLSPARDVSGAWSTLEVAFTDRILDCSYRGDMTLNLQQNGNNVVGGYTVTVTEAEGNNCVRIGSQFQYAVAGTVSSSAIDMKIAGTDDLKGSFTTDTMTLRQEKCEECGAGPAIVFAGPVILRKAS